MVNFDFDASQVGRCTRIFIIVVTLFFLVVYGGFVRWGFLEVGGEGVTLLR
jgi:hypothetical protein